MSLFNKFNASSLILSFKNSQGAAPHISGVNAIDVPSNARWLFTGADDGYVRVYDYIASMKGEKSLTIAEKYGYPDTVTKV